MTTLRASLVGRTLAACALGAAMSAALAQAESPASSPVAPAGVVKDASTAPPVPIGGVPFPSSVCQVRPAPEMPAIAAREGRAGWVEIEGVLKGTEISELHVISEAGGRGFGAMALNAMRQYQCTAPEGRSQVRFRQTFVFRLADGPPPAPAEGFGLHAFAAGSSGRLGFIETTACPVRAKLLIKQHRGQPNEVLDPGRITDSRVLAWLATLVPRTDYMTPNVAGNWVEFACSEQQGRSFLR